MKGQLDFLENIHQTKKESYSGFILNNLHQSFLLVGKNHEVIYANKYAVEIVKKEIGLDIYPGFNAIELILPYRRPIIVEIFNEALSGATRRTVNKIKKGDSVHYFEHTFKPAFCDSGETIGVIIVSTDITEKKLAEKSLQEAEERWRFALEGTTQGVWDWDLKTNKTFFSKGYLDMYGYAPGDLSGDFHEWADRIHPEDRERMLEASTMHIKEQKKFVESVYRFRAKDGRYRWIEARGMLLFDNDGRPHRMIGTHFDLTERRKNEEALKQSLNEVKLTNERFNIMMQATNDLIWDWNIKTNSFYRGDEGLKKVYGIDSHQSISSGEKWMMRVHPEDLERVQHTIAEILKPNDLNTFEVEYRFRRDDGNYSHVFDRGLILRDENGSPVRIIGAAQNISDRKRLENEMLQQELEYKKTINKATIDSQEQERSEIGKELHDNVNQILTTTKLMLEMAANEGAPKDELLAKCTKNISTVINEIRQLSRSLMDPTIHDLGILDSINDMAQAINMTNKVQVIFNYDNSIEKLLNKNQKLATFRIIQESINNIIKHAAATYAIINLSYMGDTAELIIEDNGEGFDPKTIKRGAGLNNIENRVYLINGQFSITTQPGKGCRLTIKYPLKK